MTSTEATVGLPADLFSPLETPSPRPARSSQERYSQVLADVRMARIHPSV
jgi:hypothetical protein